MVESRFADCRRVLARARRRRGGQRRRLEIKDNSFVTLLALGLRQDHDAPLIAGYIIPDHGSIEIDGRVMSSPGSVVPPEGRGMGMVFQNYAIWPHKTVFENVVFG